MPTLVLVLTDVQGSTRLWQDEPAAMDAALQRHHEIVHAAVAEHGGFRPVDQGEGDAVFAAFPSASAAVAAVAQVQRSLAAEPWPTSGPLRSRIGVHVGEVRERGGNLFGDPVNRCARLRGLASGGQTLLSAAVHELVRDTLPTGVSVRDLGEHRLKDLVRPERVWQLDIHGLSDDFAPLASLDRVLHNLPVQRSPLIGRNDELTRAVAELRTHRLVTLTGFGGMGKTRLALQVAAELVDEHPDGVWFVDLAAVTDPAAVPGAVAHVVGIRAVELDAVVEELGGREALLVLDNLEQLLGAADFVCAVLDRAPRVRVLATSREALHVRGERELGLSPLALPPAGRASATSLSTYAAVQLFVDRAVGVRPDFTVTDDNASTVATICHKLDGHPLAIELAAARIKMLTPQALLPRLDKALSVLTGGARDMPVRHQTLRATITWSYDSLQPGEQLLLQRMSVLPAAADLETVEAVCGEGVDAFGALSSLIDKSLVRVIPSEPDDRYSLLVSIASYAAEQLDAQERERVQDRHLDFFHRRYKPQPPISRELHRHLDRAAERDIDHLAAAWSRAVSGSGSALVPSFPFQYADTLAFSFGDLPTAVQVLETVKSASPGSTVDLANALAQLVGLQPELGPDVDHGDLERLRAVAAELDRPDVWLLAMMSEPLSTEATPDEVRASVRRLQELSSQVPADSPLSAEWLRDLADYGTGVRLLRVDPHAALEATRRNAASGSMGVLAEANLAHNLLLVGRHDELIERFGPQTRAGVPVTERAFAAEIAAACARALVDLGRPSEGLDLLGPWDDVFARDAFASTAALHPLATAACLGALGRPAEGLERLVGLPATTGTSASVALLTMRLSRMAGAPATADAAGALADQIAAGRYSYHLEIWLGLQVEQALLTEDRTVRRALLAEVEAERGPIYLPYGYQADLERLLREL